ncbi:MAG: chloride channel protein [Ruminococcus sp.]|nr:chloride channel protein [Ruminococcus sp.]
MNVVNNISKHEKLIAVIKYLLTFLKWLFIATLTGVFTGLVGTLFNKTISYVTDFRGSHDFIIWFLPVGGLAIVLAYKLSRVDVDAGTNMVLSSVRKHEKVHPMLAPLIFIAASITHLFGGSAGREGAALQLGGGIGFQVGRLFRLDDSDKGTIVICGMAGLFSALFGTPITAVLFAMEVISVGVFYYSAFIPAIITSLSSYVITLRFGIKPERFELKGVPDLTTFPILKVILLATAIAVLSIVFVVSLEGSHKLLKKLFKNPYIRIFAGGCAIVGLTFILGTRDYNGAGMNIVEHALHGEAEPFAFALKLIFTCITIGAGFKGGEIVPTFFIGATFGCVFGDLIGLNPAFGAAIGLIAMFCGVVNCPVASIILSIELFSDANSIVFFTLACGISYVLSGYYGLYSSQKIVYSKLKHEYININAK